MNTINDYLASAQQSNSAPQKASNDLGQPDFLKLMVAQLENQDPTKPMDNNQFLSQMAQFSMVNGIDSLNTSFGSVSDAMLGAQGLQAATLLDRRAITDTNVLAFDGKTDMNGVIELDAPAAAVEIQVWDASGVQVGAFGIDGSQGGDTAFHWNGQDSRGEQLPPGLYRFSAAGSVNGEFQSLPLGLANRIESVSLDRNTQQVVLNLANGQSVQLAEVKEYS